MSFTKCIGSPGRNPMAHSNQVTWDLNKGTIYKRCRQIWKSNNGWRKNYSFVYARFFHVSGSVLIITSKMGFIISCFAEGKSEVQRGEGSYPSMLAGEWRHSCNGSIRLPSWRFPHMFLEGNVLFPLHLSLCDEAENTALQKLMFWARCLALSNL